MVAENARSPNGADGRDALGRFAAKNTLGRGNPMAARVHEYRQGLMDAVSVEDLQRIIQSMVSLAIAGDVVAARLVLDRTCGRVASVDDHDDNADPAAVLAEFRRTLRLVVGPKHYDETTLGDEQC